ncbi:hypothetical protein OAO01_03295 [Oligoflexia bacterium]|nr:hypothetical protein [Oligoflexia bacterium]
MDPKQELEAAAIAVVGNIEHAKEAPVGVVFRAAELLGEEGRHADRKEVFTTLRDQRTTELDREQKFRVDIYFADQKRREPFEDPAAREANIKEAIRDIDVSLGRTVGNIGYSHGMTRAEFYQARSQMYRELGEFNAAVIDLSAAVQYANEHPTLVTPAWKALHHESLAGTMLDANMLSANSLDAWKDSIEKLDGDARVRSEAMLTAVLGNLALRNENLDAAVTSATQSLTFAAGLEEGRYYSGMAVTLLNAVKERDPGRTGAVDDILKNFGFS